MGFFNKYPYTDEHELNLDWIIAKINALKDRVKAIEDAIKDIVVEMPNDGKLTIKRNNTIVGDFTANQATDEDINISVPENTSDLNNDSEFITSSDLPDMDNYYDKTETDNLLNDKVDISSLAAVATSGAYADLSGQPTIPAAANNGQLTIQKNGTTIGTFTADSAVNKTVNIKVGEIQYIDINDTPTANGNIKLSTLNPSNQCVVSALILNPLMDCCLKPACWRTAGTNQIYWALNCTYNVYPYQPITDPIDVRVFYFNY